MEILRYSSDAWGQRVLEGVSWDLLWVFVGAGAMFVLVHGIYMRFFSPKQNTS